jgi:hypothetical protein
MRSRIPAWCALALLALAATGCPPTSTIERPDGITACRSLADCNPPGQTCGRVRLCIQNACAAETSVRACEDGSYPDSGVSTGNCGTFEDCNPPPFCGQVVNCIDSRCAPEAPRLEIPCLDAGEADASSADVPAIEAGPADARRD